MKTTVARSGLSLCLGLLIALLRPPLSAATPTEEMARAADNWLAALTPEQKTKATFEFADKERHNWHFIPRERKGLPIKEMTPSQRNLAYALLSSGMSQRGYIKASTIMSLEQVLKEIEGTGARFNRDSELYYFTIFGAPGAKTTWGWRVEGHHFAINFTFAQGKALVGAPNFFGSNPAEIRQGPRKGLRALAEEEDLGRQLVNSLDAAQRGVCIYTNVAPSDIITSADRKARLLEPAGLSAAKMTAAQQAQLWAVIKEYVQRTRPEMAAQDVAKIEKAGFDKVSFAWAGSLEVGKPHYYRAQGPTFLLEYDNTQNNANHIHAVWRDLEGDFGEDILKAHYQQTPHAK